jgi:hypothetical protein
MKNVRKRDFFSEKFSFLGKNFSQNFSKFALDKIAYACYNENSVRLG